MLETETCSLAVQCDDMFCSPQSITRRPNIRTKRLGGILEVAVCRCMQFHMPMERKAKSQKPVILPMQLWLSWLSAKRGSGHGHKNGGTMQQLRETLNTVPES